MYKEFLKKISVPFALVFFPNIIFMLLGLYFTIPRPYIVYDYFLLFILFYFNCSTLLIWSTFMGLLLVDSISITSSIYLFTIDSFIRNIGFIGNYKFQLPHFLLFFFLLISLFYCYRFIKKYRHAGYKTKTYVFSVLLVFSLTFILDSFNGSSFVELNKSQRIFTKNNIAGSVAFLYYHNLDNMLITGSKIQAPEQLPKSITFQTFGDNDQGNQLLVVVESFGLIRDSSIRQKFFNSVLSEFQKNGWKGSLGNTPFKGSTTAAEMRELLSLLGDYRFFLNQTKKSKYTSIFDVKLAQGYETIGVHSFAGNMFERNLWWKTIGIKSSYFMEDILLENRYTLQLNYDTPLTSCQDEDAFDFLQSKVVGKQKVFGYLLSVNSHLPYIGHFRDATASSAFIRNFDGLTDEGRNQLIRIRSFLSYIAQNLDLGKWSNVLIVGDHMPPFLNKTDRDFYSAEKVPYLRIEKP
jgi:hypothetical protein